MPTPYGASKGRLFLLKVTDGVSPADYTSVGGLRAATASIANAVVDITTKDEAPWKTLLANTGDRSLSISGSGIFKDSVGENYVRGFSINGAMANFQLTAEDGDTITGSFLVSKFEYTGNYNGAQEYSMTLESSGPVVLTPHI